jgi:hypothetical protein
MFSLVLAASPLRGAAQAPSARIAFFPLENASEKGTPLKRIGEAFEKSLAGAGLEVVSGDAVERFLAANRLRYTGGVSQGAARAAREALGVQGILITSVLEYRTGPPPRMAVVARLVSTEDAPNILWIDGASLDGNENPGLLNLGVIGSIEEVQRIVLDSLAASLASFVTGEGPGARPCESNSRFKPRVAFRSSLLETGTPRTIAVLPFGNRSTRSRAGMAVQLEVLRQIVALNRFRVQEPGVVRDTLLRNRIVLESGVSVDDARALRLDIATDLILTGEVFDLSEGLTPQASLSIAVLDGRLSEVVWMSNSYNRGDDGVFFFDTGRVATASELVCRMVRRVVDGMDGDTPSRPRTPGQTFEEWHRGAFGRPKTGPP